MIGIAYVKSKPTTFVAQYRGGKCVRSGEGLSFFYFAPSCTIVSINTSSVDIPFVFEDTTRDFQDVTVQGQLTYRVMEPLTLAKTLDFSVNRAGRYLSDDPSKLSDRLIQAAQVSSRAFVQQRELAEILTASDELSSNLTRVMHDAPSCKMHGVEVLAIAVLSIKAKPEMVKAMQADAREKLLLKADQAVYARRNTAIELERQLTENQLETDRAVEERKREVRSAQMEADITIERKRRELVETQVANERMMAEARSEMLRATLDAVRNVDWRVLSATFGTADSRTTIAMAFQQLAENAEKIGRLEISPDLLRMLVDRDKEE